MVAPLVLLAPLARAAGTLGNVVKAGAKRNSGVGSKSGTKSGSKIFLYMPPEEIEKLTIDIQNDMIENVKHQLVIDDINFTGGLSASVRAGQQGDFKTVEIDSPYAYHVEFGLPPGQKVSFDALLKWVQEKLGVSNKKEAKNVTYKIRSKILAKGIKPTRFFKKAILRLGRYNKLVGNKGLTGTRKISRSKRK